MQVFVQFNNYAVKFDAQQAFLRLRVIDRRQYSTKLAIVNALDLVAQGGSSNIFGFRKWQGRPVGDSAAALSSSLNESCFFPMMES